MNKPPFSAVANAPYSAGRSVNRSDKYKPDKSESELTVSVSQSEHDRVVVHHPTVRHHQRAGEPLHQNGTDQPERHRMSISTADRIR